MAPGRIRRTAGARRSRTGAPPPCTRSRDGQTQAARHTSRRGSPQGRPGRASSRATAANHRQDGQKHIEPASCNNGEPDRALSKPQSGLRGTTSWSVSRSGGGPTPARLRHQAADGATEAGRLDELRGLRQDSAFRPSTACGDASAGWWPGAGRDREVLTAILFVMTTGCMWRQWAPVFGSAWPVACRRFAQSDTAPPQTSANGVARMHGPVLLRTPPEHSPTRALSTNGV